MANENKLTTMGQMRDFAQRQDARDDEQDEKLRQLDEENDGVLKYTEQTLTEAQKAQARANIGVEAPVAMTTAEIDAILAT